MRYTVPIGLDVIASEQITVSSSAVGVTAALLIDPVKTWARIQAKDGDINYRLDGTDPTTTVGVLLQAGSSVEIRGRNNVERLRMIATGADVEVFVELGRN